MSDSKASSVSGGGLSEGNQPRRSAGDQQRTEVIPAQERSELARETSSPTANRQSVRQQRVSSPLSETVPPRGRVGESVVAAKQFGRYKLLGVLGEGAMGKVFLAEDPQLDRQVALKIPKVDGDDATELKQRFLGEARAAATLRHPNICPVHDIGEHAGQPYITMAYIKGQPLSRFITPTSIASFSKSLMVISKLASALTEAHQHGVIHRDLKPGNIMIDDRGEPVIMDFGLALRTNLPDETRATEAGTILGTPAYMSPEQVEGKNITPATDVYSLGVILYELLSGHLPFDGSVASVLGQIVHQPPKPLQSYRNDLPTEVIALCEKMMAKSPHERYSSMAEVAADVSQLYEKFSTKSTSNGARESQSKKRTAATTETKVFRASDAEALTNAARDCLKARDYAQAIEILESIPGSHRSEEILKLHERVIELQEEVDFLIADMEEAARTKQYEGLEENLHRLLKLKPNYRPARELLEELNTYSRGGKLRAARPGDPHYHKDEGVGRPLAFGLGGIALLGLLVYGVMTFYLKSAAGVIRVTVYDSAVTITLDGDSLTLIDGEAKTNVKVGDHTLIIQRDGLKTLATDFLIEKGDSKIFRVELVDGQLAVVEDRPVSNTPDQPPAIADAGVVPASDTVSADPLTGACLFTIKGACEFSLNGTPFHADDNSDATISEMGVTKAMTYKPGDILTLRLQSPWTYKGIIFAIVGEDGRTISIKRSDCAVIPDTTPIAGLTAEVIRNVGTPVADRGPDKTKRQVWTDRNIANQTSEWFWPEQGGSKEWKTVAIVIRPDMLAGAAATANNTSTETPAATVAADVQDLKRAGLIGYATVAGKDVPVAFRYQHGKIFQSSNFHPFVTAPETKPVNAVVTFRGQLTLAEKTTITVSLGGGSPNGGYCYPKVGDIVFNKLGDNVSKSYQQEIELEAGVYPIEWKLTGGSYGPSLFRLADKSTGKLLPVTFTDADILDVPVNETVLTSTDKPGFPVNGAWMDRTVPAWDAAEIAKIPLK